MPALLAPLYAFLASAFMFMFQFFGTYLARRLAGRVAAVSLLIGIWATFATYIQAGLDAMIYWIDPGVVKFGLQLLPYNTNDCVAIILTTYFAEFVFYQMNRVINVKMAY